MQKIERMLKTIWLSVVLFCLSGTFILLLIQIFSRFVLNTPLLGIDEIAMLLFVWMVFIGATSVVKDGDMIRMNVVSRFLPTRSQQYLEIVFNLVFMVVCIFFVPASIRHLKQSWIFTFNITQIPYTFFYLSGTLFFLCSVVLCAMKIPNLLRKINRTVPAHSDEGETL